MLFVGSNAPVSVREMHASVIDAFAGLGGSRAKRCAVNHGVGDGIGRMGRMPMYRRAGNNASVVLVSAGVADTDSRGETVARVRGLVESYWEREGIGYT